MHRGEAGPGDAGQGQFSQILTIAGCSSKLQHNHHQPLCYECLHVADYCCMNRKQMRLELVLQQKTCGGFLARRLQQCSRSMAYLRRKLLVRGHRPPTSLSPSLTCASELSFLLGFKTPFCQNWFSALEAAKDVSDFHLP